MSEMIKFCKNRKCSNMVPTTKNPGKERLYCSFRCGQRERAHRWYTRERDAARAKVRK